MVFCIVLLLGGIVVKEINLLTPDFSVITGTVLRKP